MDQNEIAVAAATMEARRDELNANLSKFEREVEYFSSSMESIRTMWEGDAAAAYEESLRREKLRLESAVEGLRGYVTVLEGIIRTYRETEQHIVEFIGSC